jgi:3-oxoacyl-[acyl-carrier protein] reductase
MMNLNIADKVALVTGSSRGIGYEIASALHREGCKVAINGLIEEHLDVAERQFPNCLKVVGNMSDPTDAKKVIEMVLSKFGRLDILVCNVGGGSSVPPGTESLDEWQRVFGLNLWSTTNSVEASKIALAESKGSIVCISSICGLQVISGAPLTYSVAKAALNAYIRGISRPLALLGVRINGVAPGNILFDGSVWEAKLASDKSGVLGMLEQKVPLNRLGTAKEVADLVTYLASPLSQFATGAIWTLDGGQVCS